MPDKYLFLYLNTGGGHLAPAKALSDYMHEFFADKVNVKLADGFQGVSPLIKIPIENGYRQSQSKGVWVYEVMYALHKWNPLAKLTSNLVSFFVKSRLRDHIVRENPSTIVVFHFLLIQPVMDLVRDLKLNSAVVVVVTDPFTAHPMWFLHKAHHYIVFSQRLKEYCSTMGIDPVHVNVFPFILGHKYSSPMSTREIRILKENMGFDPDKKMVLILGGGDGMPHGYEIVKAFMKLKLPYQVAIVCGRNKGLYKKLHELKIRKQYRSLKIYDFVGFIYELINMSDVVVTKCGASTFMEVLMMGKVAVVNNYLWEQEKGNIEFLCDSQMGIYERDISKLPFRIAGVLDDTLQYNYYVENIKKQQLQNGIALVSDFLLSKSS